MTALVQDGRADQFPTIAPDQQAALLSDFAGHPGFAGFYLYDEPKAPLFANLATVKTALANSGTDVGLSYVNIFPNYASATQIGAPSYQAYLDDYMATFQPPMLSFDFYPYPDWADVHPDYFTNWAAIRAAGLAADVPTWVFVQAVGWSGRRRPDADELRWQMSISLAYGAKGIQYYRYWSRPEFPNALITEDGTRTDLYDAATEINNAFVQPVGRELLPLRSESVLHANYATLPAGAVAFTGDNYVAQVSGSPAVIGTFVNPSGQSQTRWALVANGDHASTANLTVDFGPSVCNAAEFNPAYRRYESVWNTQSAPLAVTVAPGAARLYRLQTNQRRLPARP